MILINVGEIIYSPHNILGKLQYLRYLHTVDINAKKNINIHSVRNNTAINIATTVKWMAINEECLTRCWLKSLTVSI